MRRRIVHAVTAGGVSIVLAGFTAGSIAADSMDYALIRFFGHEQHAAKVEQVRDPVVVAVPATAQQGDVLELSPGDAADGTTSTGARGDGP